MRTHGPSFSAFMSEFLKLSGVTEADAARALSKIAAPVTEEDALRSLRRLEELNSSKPKGSDLVRGSIIGSGVGTVASAANQLVSGKAQEAFRSALANRQPGWGGLARGIGRGAATMGRNMAGTAASSAVVGTLAPIAKRVGDERAEINRIQSYLGEGNATPLRRGITEYTGV